MKTTLYQFRNKIFENVICRQRYKNYVILGSAVFVSLETIPLKAKFTIRNHPHKYTWLTILHGPLCVPSLFN